MAKYNLHIVALPYHDLKGCLGEFYAEVMGQSVTMMQDISNEVDDKAVIVYGYSMFIIVYNCKSTNFFVTTKSKWRKLHLPDFLVTLASQKLQCTRK